jgi:hypothetical protein
MHADNMPDMEHCHEGAKSQDTDKSSTGHKSCAMGAGCHFTQVTPPLDSSSKYVFADSTVIAFPKFILSAKSIDLSPPLKPPA